MDRSSTATPAPTALRAARAPRRSVRRLAAIGVASALIGSVGVAAAGGATRAPAPRASGTVTVLYAGSLLALMDQSLAPAFHAATGYTLSGISAGSKALASQIKSGIVAGDVFISASPKVNDSLAGASNGSWVSAYAEFGYSDLVLGYNPASRFASALRHQPWYDVVVRPGFRLGRTDPTVDPKGVLAVNALMGISLCYGRPGLATLASSSTNVFDETSLVGELQSGQLDAGFFYQVEADAAKLSTVRLTSTQLEANYTVALLNRAPHSAAARAFVAFLLGPTARRIFTANGVTFYNKVMVHRYA